MQQIVVNPPGYIGKKNIFKQKTKKYTLQNKKIITSIKSCGSKEDGQVVWKMNVRGKSVNLSDRRHLTC